MKIIIDSNRVIASLIKDSTTRKIIFDGFFEFFAPEHIKNEIAEHREEIIKKIGINSNEFDILVSMIFENITIIPQTEYSQFIYSLKNEIKDLDDVPYLAVYKVVNAEGLWTHDIHFKEQKKFRIMTNSDLLKLANKVNKEG